MIIFDILNFYFEMDEKKNFKKEELMIVVIFNVYDRFKVFLNDVIYF